MIRIDIDRDVIGFRPEKGQADKYGNLIEDRIYNQKDFNRTLVIEERDWLVAQKITAYLKATNRFDKTIVFCEDTLNVTTKDDLSSKREAIVSKALEYLIMNLKADRYGNFCSYEGIVDMHRQILKDCFPALAGVDRAEAQLNTFRFNSFYQDISDPNIDMVRLREEKPNLSVFEDCSQIRSAGTALFQKLQQTLYSEDGPAYAGKPLPEKKGLFAKAKAEAALEFNRIHPFCDSNGIVFDTLVSVLAFHQKLTWDKKRGY